MGQTISQTKSKTRIRFQIIPIAEIVLELQALELKCDLEVIFYNKICDV